MSESKEEEDYEHSFYTESNVTSKTDALLFSFPFTPDCIICCA